MTDTPTRRGPWIVNASRTVYDNPWIQVTEHDVTDPGGNPGLYGVCGVKSVAVGIVPVDAEGHVWLVGQHRFPRDYYSWELPEGGGGRSVPPIDSARRELKEETGLTAATWLEILQTDFTNAISDEIGFGYLAWDLTVGTPDPDPDEKIEIRRLPFAQVLEMVLDGEIRDGFSQNMLMKVDLMGRRGRLPAPVALALGYGA